MKKDGLSGKKHVCVRRQLLLANSMFYDIEQVRKDGKLKSLLGKCKLVKKYRCVSSLSNELKIHRRTSALTGTSNKRQSKNSERKATVIEFLEREDNSTTLPAKKDHLKHQESREVKQKRVLTDYSPNLHEKFMLKNPDVKVCKSAFFTMKPSNIEYDSNEKILGEINEKFTEVKYFNWKRVQDGEKLRWKEVEGKISKTAFNDPFNKELTAFRGHVQRTQKQYIEMRRLRENLKDGNIRIWMDFAENYNCSAVKEIQSAYLNTAMVSLHTMVVYFPEGHIKKLQSMVAVSDLVQHNATTVFTILKKTIPIVKEEYPELTTVHYLTDSPTSQYRNRYVFQILANHEADFGMKGRWNYLEAGHGKDPCDGLGASVK
ncbi:unnamed protein product [Mytilus coruscus]|uniref:Uncharacterized protein n=1 Tax=Mytilus coruscus TaxID=42192 RepID=A0A6J8DPY9_MYTCO|nr:unnamed protein product [Mytilus coruscus]